MLLPREEKSLGIRWERLFAPADSLAMAYTMREGLQADEGLFHGISDTIFDLEAISGTHKRLKKAYRDLLHAQDDEKRCRDGVALLMDALADVPHTRRPLLDDAVEVALRELQTRCAQAAKNDL